MRYRIGLFLVTSIACSLIAGCDGASNDANNRSSPRAAESTPAAKPEPTSRSLTVNGKTLDAKMSDAEILAVFGVDESKATSKRSAGPDGYSMTYTQGDQNVSIAHSVVTGINVIAWGPIKGDWKLGGPRAE